MVYKHRMKNGKIRHYSNKQSYLNSVRGMFGNQYQKKNHSRKITKAKSKRQMKHRGVGKVSSVKKKECEYCTRKDLPLTKGKCKDCEKLLTEYKQPEEKHKLSEEIKDLGTFYSPPIPDEDLLEIQRLIDKINEFIPTNQWDEIEDNMKDINDLMKGSGIEWLAEEREGEKIDLMYVNMGDSYDTTVIFDLEEGIARIGDWGTYYDEFQSNYPDEDYDVDEAEEGVHY